MGTDFLSYMQHLEMMAFFSGYPLVYAVILYLSGENHIKNYFSSGSILLMPFAYALIGTLYLGLQLKNFYPDYSIENISHRIQQPFPVIWGILATLFWTPSLARKNVLSLLHSLVFLFLFIKDIFTASSASQQDDSLLKNDMKIYTTSLILTVAALVTVCLYSFLKRYFTKSLKR